MTSNSQRIAEVKLSAVKWKVEAELEAKEGNMVGAFRRYQYSLADLEFVKLLEAPLVIDANPYVRYGDATNPSSIMVYIGPYQTVQKAYYDKYVGKAIPARSVSDDNKELQSGEAGQGGV